MADRFKNQVTMLDSPVSDGFAITPNNSITFSQPTRGILVGTAGAVKVMFSDKTNANTVLIIPFLSAGIVHPLRVQRVYAGNTTATNIVGLF